MTSLWSLPLSLPAGLEIVRAGSNAPITVRLTRAELNFMLIVIAQSEFRFFA